MKRLLTNLMTILLPILNTEAQEIFEQQNDQFVRSLMIHILCLRFLQTTQNEDGTWSDTSYGSQPGVLGMAVLAFLSRGDDPEFGTFSKSLKKLFNKYSTNKTRKQVTSVHLCTTMVLRHLP